MKNGLIEVGFRGLRFFASAISTTYVGLKSAVAPATSFDLTLPSELPVATSSLTVTSAGQIGYSSLSNGSVTSVALTAPSIFSVANSPITSSGTLALSLANQAANSVWAGPSTGVATAPTFRALVSADIPTLTASFISDFNTAVRTNRLDQLAAPTASVDFGGQKGTGVGTPTLDSDIANKIYVDNAITSSSTYKGTANASAANPTAATGVSSWRNGWTYRITTAGNTAFAFQANVGDYVIYNGTTWDLLDSSDPTVTGTANRISVSGNTDTGYTADISSAYVGQSSITTLGNISTGAWQGTAVAVQYGGTGATTISGARTALGASGKFTSNFTDANLTAGILTITHNLSNQYPYLVIYDNNNKIILPDEITGTSTTVSTVDLNTYGTIAGTWRVTVLG